MTVRPDIAGNMAAYGAALLARDRAHAKEAALGVPAQTTMLGLDALRALEPTHRNVRCKACSNHCLLTINDFGIDEETGKRRRFITGNRCEKGAGLAEEAAKFQTCSNIRPIAYSIIISPYPRKRQLVPRLVFLVPSNIVRKLSVLVLRSLPNLVSRVELSDPSTKKHTKRVLSLCLPRVCATQPSYLTVIS